MARSRGNSEKPVELAGNQAVSQSLSQSRRKKAAKGTVVVQVFKERLRLCWSYLGKRYFLYIGLPDSKVNRVVADQKARWIEGDMATGNFDLSLKKYKPEIYKVNRMFAIDLLKQFIDHKSKEVYSRSLEKYQATLKHLDQFLKEVPDRLVSDIDAAEAEDFANWLSGKITPITAKERLTVLSACWNWGIKQGMVEVNPWQNLVSRIKVPPRQMPKPFTREEMRAIILQTIL
jgi:integrase